MTAADYKVLQISDPRPWSGQHGEKVDYWVKVQNGADIEDALLTQLPTTPAPTVGQVVYGRLEQRTSQKGNLYNKFRKEQREDSFALKTDDAAATPAAGRLTGQSFNKDAEIRWQVCLKVAGQVAQGKDPVLPSDVISFATELFKASPPSQENRQAGAVDTSVAAPPAAPPSDPLLEQAKSLGLEPYDDIPF